MNFKELESKQKLRGGYYTPQTIATVLCQWALADGATTILEPSCGDGNFLQAIYKYMMQANRPVKLSIEAIEIVPEEAAKAEKMCAKLRTLGAEVRVINYDIFSWLGNGNAERKWDAIIGNPPYIRYQYFENNQREIAEAIFKKANVPFSKRTNAWVPLIIASIMHLEPGGRLAMVVPAELLHIQHASGLRQLIEQEMETITLLNIREMVFPDALQGVVLVLGVKRRDRKFMPLIQIRADQPSLMFQEPETKAKISVVDVVDINDLSKLDVFRIEQCMQKNIDDTAGEWMQGLLTEEEASLLRHLKARKDVFRFDTVAEVDIGIVTGANSFFVVDEYTLQKYNLQSIATPMLAKSELIKGITYTAQDHEANARAGKSVYLLNFPEKPVFDLSEGMAQYIRLGEAQKLHERYKCRIRNPWYVVPYVWASEVSLLKRCHLFPKLVVNVLQAYSTDTAYRIRMKPDYSTRTKDITFSFLNSLTFLSAELEGRHYGGGVLELVPSEIERLLVPLRPVAEDIFAHLDAMIRNNATLDQIVDFTDPLILGEGLGLTDIEICTIRKAHRRLLKRRLRT